MLPSAPTELEMLARLWQRESRLLPLALYFDAEDLGGTDMERSGAAQPFSLAQRRRVFCRRPRIQFPDRPGRAKRWIDVASPLPSEQQTAWKVRLGDQAGDTAGAVGRPVQSQPAGHRIAGRTGARHRTGDNAPPLADAVWDACRSSERPRLDALAQRLEPKVGWDDLVLPKAEIDAAEADRRAGGAAQQGLSRMGI